MSETKTAGERYGIAVQKFAAGEIDAAELNEAREACFRAIGHEPPPAPGVKQGDDKPAGKQ